MIATAPDLCPAHLCSAWTDAFGDCAAFCPSAQAFDAHVVAIRERISTLSAEPFTEPTVDRVNRLYTIRELKRELRVLGVAD